MKNGYVPLWELSEAQRPHGDAFDREISPDAGMYSPDAAIRMEFPEGSRSPMRRQISGTTFRSELEVSPMRRQISGTTFRSELEVDGPRSPMRRSISGTTFRSELEVVGFRATSQDSVMSTPLCIRKGSKSYSIQEELLSDHIEKQERYWTYKFILLNPNDSFVLLSWDMYITFCLVYIAVVGPFEAAFSEIRYAFVPSMVVNVILDVSFIVDLLVGFISAQPDPTSQNLMITNPRTVAVRYLKCWFWLDLVSVMPLDLYCVLIGHCSAEGRGLATVFAEGGMIRWFRVVRLLRLTKIKRMIDRWHAAVAIRYAWLSLAQLSLIIIISSHWTACLWAGLAWNYEPSSPDDRTWLVAMKQFKGGDDRLYDDVMDVYGMALYWSVMTITSIGYGDITPQNRREYYVATVCMLYMALVWAYVIGGICGVVSTMQPHEVAYKQTMDDLNDLMENCTMPQDMRKDLRTYFYQAKALSRQRVERAVLDKMSPSLQGEVALFLHEKYIEKVPYLRSLEREVHIEASRSLRMMVYPPYEMIAAPRCLFILREGIVMRKTSILTNGSVWGEDHLLSNVNLRDRSAARALSYVHVLMLHAADVYRLIDKFPEAVKSVRWRKNTIALWRAVQKLSAFAIEIGVGRWQEASQCLTEEQKQHLFKDICHDRIVPDNMDAYVAEMQASRAKKVLETRDPLHVVDGLAATVNIMAKQMLELQHVQAEILTTIQAQRVN